MAIPESQLETWSHQGAIATAKNTHESIRHCLLADSRSLVKRRGIDIFLQGSYKNDTNIYGDSDVDVVVLLTDNFTWDGPTLPYGEQALLQQAMNFGGAAYTWTQYRQEVLATLRTYYGTASIQDRPKCIKVLAGPGRLSADVILCFEHQRYTRFRSWTDEHHHKGISFFLPDGTRVVNFPKQHYDNGVGKHSQANTNGWYKPTVRIFKNLRGAMVDRRVIAADLAPSYFVESLVYNAPNGCFGASFDSTIVDTLNWMSAVPLGGLMSKNGLVPLCGAGSTFWPQVNAQTFIRSAINFWNGWN